MGRKYVLMFVASTLGTEFAIEERRKEGEKERRERREEGGSIELLLLSIISHFSDFLGRISLPCAQSWCWV